MVVRKNAISSSDRVMPSWRPTAFSSSGVGSFALATRLLLLSDYAAPPYASLDVDDVLLVVVRVLLQIAHGLRVRRFLLRPALHHLERPVLRFGDVDVEGAVVRLRIDRGLARGPGVADVALQRLDHLHAVDAVGLLHAERPEMHAVIGLDGQRRDILAARAVLRQELLEEFLVGRRVDFLEVALGRDV